MEIKKQPVPQRSCRPIIRENRWAETDGGTEGSVETSVMDIRNVTRLIIYPRMVKFAADMMLQRDFIRLHYSAFLSPAAIRALLPHKIAQFRSSYLLSNCLFKCVLLNCLRNYPGSEPFHSRERRQR